MSELSHVRADGTAHMVDVSAKSVTARSATAEAVIATTADVVEQIFAGTAPKGDVLAVARVAGIMAAKRTPELVPLCHPLPISGVTVDFTRLPAGVHIRTRVKTTAVTGVEMEALTAASVAALTVYDMIKALDKAAEITITRVVTKTGGKSGDYHRAADEEGAGHEQG